MKRNLLLKFVWMMALVMIGFAGFGQRAFTGKQASNLMPAAQGFALKAADQVVIEDFEEIFEMNFYVFANGPYDGYGQGIEVVENPDPDEVNDSHQVMQFIRSADGSPWAGMFWDPEEPVDFSEMKYVHVQVWKPLVGRVVFKLEGGTTGQPVLEVASMEAHSAVGAWEHLVFDFSAAEGSYGRLTFFPDFPASVDYEEDFLVYFDNIILSSSPEIPLDEEADHLVIHDFESRFFVFANGPYDGYGEGIRLIDNPAPDNVNSSDRVMEFIRSADGSPWAGMFWKPEVPVDFSEMKYIHVQVWKPLISRVVFKLEAGTTGQPILEVPSMEPQTVTGEWETLVFDFSAANGTYERLVFFPDFPTTPLDHEEDFLVYLDNVVLSSSPEVPELHKVTLNVDMDGAVAAGNVVFNPEVHSVYVTGGFAGWAMPGSNTQFEMFPASGKAEGHIYTIDLFVEEGEYPYKYFLVEDEPTWDMGEWAGDPNRLLTVTGPTVMNEIFGVQQGDEPGEPGFFLSYDVASTAGTAIYRAEHYSVWISNTTNDPADFTMLFEETLSTEIPNWDYQQREIDITEYAGDEVYVAFRHHESTDMDRVMINNVKIHFVGDAKAGHELVVFSEDFNGGIGHEDGSAWLPEGWVAVDADGDDYNWYYAVYQGDGYMLSRSVINIGGEYVPLTPDNWLFTPSILIEEPPTYTVTFTVKNEDGEGIETAVVTLGTTVNAAGDYVFEGIPAGTYTYTVVATGYLNVSVGELLVEGDLAVDVVMEVAPPGSEVTFNVNMAGAVAEGDVEFDPEVHRVFITGSITDPDWIQPGANDAYEMHPAPEAKNEEPQFLLPGNWANRSGEATYTWGEGEGYAFGTNIYDDKGYGQIFNIDQEYTITGAYYWIGARNGTTGQVVFTLWDYADGSVGSVLASKTVDLGDITASTTFEEAFLVEFDEPVTVSDNFFIGANISGLSAFQDGTYGLGNMSSMNGDNAAGLALVQEGAAWVAVADYGLNVDVAIFPTLAEGQEPPLEPLIYTLTINLEDGEYQYKYFMVIDEPNWGIGEWPGDPNRDLVVSGAMVVNDVFGQQPDDPTIVDEPVAEGTVVYPNPVRDMLNIQASSVIDQIRVFDISGRVIYQTTANDTHVQVNVNQFAKGLYILQVVSGNEVQTHKFQVYK